jgi:predicted Holliday junction resolvase-like endonuclease
MDMETRIDRIERYIEEFAKGMFELRESQKHTDIQIMELREAQKHTDVQIMELREAQKKTDEQLKKTIKKLDDVGVNLGKLGIVQGEVAEELFYRNVKGLFDPLDWRFCRIRRNVKVKGYGEYDIVADEKGRVLVIEVKNKLDRRMVDEFMQKKLPRFKTLLPEYQDSRILAGIGALVVKDDVGRYAEKSGLFVLTQTSDGGVTLINRKDFRPKEFS